QRPCASCAAQKRDELPSSQSIELHSVSTSQGRITGYRIAEDQSGGNGNDLQPVRSEWDHPRRAPPRSRQELLQRIREELGTVCAKALAEGERTARDGADHDLIPKGQRSVR